MERLFVARGSKPTLWERGLAQFALFLWAIEWITRGLHGAVEAVASMCLPWWACLSYAASSIVLAGAGGMLAYAILRPVGERTNLREVWALFRMSFTLALASWSGIIAFHVLARPEPRWWLSAATNVALCVLGLIAVHQQEKTVTRCVHQFNKQKAALRERCERAAA